MNRISLIILCIVIAFVLSSCNNESSNASIIEQPHKVADTAGSGITVTAGGSETNEAVKSNSRSIEIIDYENTELYQMIMNDSKGSIPYVELGESIQIAFSGEPPDSYQLTDNVLLEDGTIKYGGQRQAVRPINIKFDHGIGSFILRGNMSTMYSSNMKDDEPGATIRGFRLTGTWKNEIKEYVFIIRTDARKKS
ncbi:hypothetical protein PAECIP111893_01148 [Paenibacillus plantiphilus]|uniref:Uncharacterized protein n=1 Tax=Paenibacillus plantiphilus TaxID=2905650 RepID=A0ABM9C0Z1_9BACL|nr:hypothetical protein [Paenibacillus plantiphilus]CAH1198880.1 hypothetical protein PAECIP111893_01148 [Paenibacillus plantiphilus]